MRVISVENRNQKKEAEITMTEHFKALSNQSFPEFKRIQNANAIPKIPMYRNAVPFVANASPIDNPARTIVEKVIFLRSFKTTLFVAASG